MSHQNEDTETKGKGSGNSSMVQIAVALIAFVGTVTAAYFAFRGAVAPVELTLGATASAQASPPGTTTLVNADPVRLTDEPGNEIVATFSDDGRFIVYITDANGNQEIYTMHADGLINRRETMTANSEDLPTFSPDGRKILFAANYDGNEEIYILEWDGSQRITNISNMPASDEGRPRFTAGGNSIIFDSNRTGDWELYIADYHDESLTNPRNLTHRSEYQDRFPVVSALGQKVFFRAGAIFDEPEVKSNLYSVQVDGTDLRMVTAGPNDRYPSVTADEKWLAFQSDRDGNKEIYVLHIESGDIRRMTDHPADDSFPSFSRDGRWIVFSSNRSGTGYDIYKMPFSP